MRAFEFLHEFAPSNITPEKAPSPAEADQDKKDIMTLIGLKPSSEALSKVKELLGQEEPDAQIEKTPVQIQKNKAQQQSSDSLNQQTNIEKTESIELDEDVMSALVERIKSLDPNNPKDALKISQIEAILEDDVIEPAVISIVQPKFRSHKENIAADLKGALMKAPNPVLEKISFLEKCKNGFVDLKSTFESNKKGNIYQTASDKVLDNIKVKIASIEYGVGASRLGKMEVLLTLIGKGVSKEGAGDLTLTDGTEVEIKASSTVPKIEKSGYTTSGAVLYALAKDESGESLYGSNHTAGTIWEDKMTKILPVVPLSLNVSSIEKQINPYIKGNKKKIDYTVNAIKEVYRTIFRKASDKEINTLDKIASLDGINSELLVKLSRMIEFEYYKKAIGHSAVLFVNTTSGNYQYVEKASDLGKTISSGSKDSSFYSTGVLDMKGTYTNGLSKIFIA